MKIKFVVATRVSEEKFWTDTATGRSLSLYRFPFLEVLLSANNKEGLPKIYNRSIESSIQDPAILIFAHDDIHLTDFYWVDQVVNALNHFQLVGLAGNKRRLPNQPAWAFINRQFDWDHSENLSGLVGHGKGFPPKNLSFYGPPAQPVKLLDGVMLSTHSDTLKDSSIRFDEQFDFHFYDMDFCRSFESKGLAMGTWPISLVHESGGAFGSEGWDNALQKYLAKWGD